MLFYVGTYTGPKSKGIYLYDLDLQTGRVTSQGLAGETNNPSFLTFHPNGRFVYAVNETGSFSGRKTGSVTAFAMDLNTFRLTTLNQTASEGTAPCFVTVDQSGRACLIANYSSGTFTLLPIAEDGSLRDASCVIQDEGKGPNAQRQEGPHAHSINLDPSGQFALGADLGIDRVRIFKLDPLNGQLVVHRDTPVAPGAGPRHLSFAPNKRFAYLLTEMGNTVITYAWDAQAGALTELQTLSTIPSDFTAFTKAAEVVVHPSGRFVYCSNRGHDSIAMFSVDQGTGKLTLIGFTSVMGKNPRNFTVDPLGRFCIVANQDTDNLTVFQVDQATGKLDHIGTSEATKPVCVRFVPQR